MKSKKTIAYVGGFELPDKNAAAQRVLANAKIFRDLGYNVILIGIDKSLSLESSIIITKSSIQGFETWSIPYPSSKKMWFNHITSIDYIKSIVENNYNDLYAIIGYNYPAIAQYNLIKYTQKNSAYYIADIAEWHESNGGNILFNTIKWLDTTMRMRLVNLKADGIITISKYLTNFYKVKNCTTIELPTLFDVEKFNTVDLPAKKQKNIIKLTYAGSAFNLARLDKNRTSIKDRLDKIISILDKVYQKKTNFTLDIYGLEKENYLTVFPGHLDTLNRLSDVITFHGRKPHLQIVQALQESDFSIFIRNIERVIEAGFPTKFSESISYGTPVISNMISNIEPYAVEGKNSYIISLNDEVKQVKKMIQILNLTAEERYTMKEYCLENKIFDYREHTISVKKFLGKVETSK